MAQHLRRNHCRAREPLPPCGHWVSTGQRVCDHADGELVRHGNDWDGFYRRCVCVVGRFILRRAKNQGNATRGCGGGVDYVA